MEVGSCLENQLHSWVSTKSKAPSPPGLKRLESPGFSQRYPGNPYLKMDQKENLIDKELSLTVVLPGGVETTAIVHGSEPLMDLLVTLCAKYRLNPSSHTLELITSNKNNIKLKPSALIGTLDAEKIILKPKGEDKNKKTGPQMPEATVRMVINYKKTQKTILRVNPRVPLAELLPAICEKCEFDVETTILLKDVQSRTPLNLSNSLNDYAIREVYARDTQAQPATPVCPDSPTYAGTVTPGKDKTQKEKENKGLFGVFRKSKKKSDQPTTASAPASPVLVSKPRPLSMALPSSNSSPLGSPTISTDAPKKRRAPQPPILVSQSCTSDPRTRQRLYSEPNVRLHGDQVCGLSRGSSAESSLKRTKRKAPPPPASPSAVAQEPVLPDENVQAGDAAHRLEEIREQEEMTASVMSATASKMQGVDDSLNTSSDVSPHSPSPDVEIQSMMSVEDQSPDLSSDGNQQQSTVNDSVTQTVRKTDGADSSELADTNCVPLQVENSICQESATHSVETECNTTTSSLPPPVMLNAETQASVQANAESLRENSVATSTSCSTGEDAQVQSNFTQLPVPPPNNADEDSSPAIAPVCESPGKKDMATLTEDLGPPELEQALPPTSETSLCQDSTPSAPVTAKVPPMYATDSEPKPKPSNELTRDYIPKVGMTTYTIVPPKSQEKLRYFEVALTLETPTEASQQVLNTDSAHSDESTRQMEQEVSKEKSELHSTLHREDGLPNTATNQHTVNGGIPESTQLSSPTSLCNTDKVSSSVGASPAGSPAEVKEMKIPPATKPKPASFRLSQHKKTPGYYVTSAAEKSLGANSSSGLREVQGSAERANLPPPPLPPPAQCDEETTGAANIQLSHKQVNRNVPLMRMTRQSSLPAREPSTGLSLEKFRSFAAPRPYSPATPSRFAQAVSSAVKRSHSVTYRPKPPLSPVLTPVSPTPSLSSVTESKQLSKLKDCEHSEVDSNGSTLQSEGGEPPSNSDNVQTGESGP
ncbi:cordon-bleu protein-like 1b isoform X4 [Haplochromis burtoni]|uniref:cordon-bleu protein-like 1b isoform X4 n=1 Tax=Haplochromis burtoni TaxID=8153 RepID=UPI0006C99740|nr:cordon-bleu protein-like 1b isoform X4 [Haplochromis burtoni]